MGRMDFKVVKARCTNISCSTNEQLCNFSITQFSSPYTHFKESLNSLGSNINEAYYIVVKSYLHK